MKHFFFLLLGSLFLLGGAPAWAQTPIGNVDIASGQTTTLSGAPQGSNNYYQTVVIHSTGRGIVNDNEYVSNLTVETGGILQVNAPGALRSANTANASITLQPGARLELATPSGLPFGQGQRTTSFGGGFPGGGGFSFQVANPPYTLTISPAVFYTFNGTTAQSSAAPASSILFGFGTQSSLANGVALPATVGRLTVSNSAGFTLVNGTGVSQEVHLLKGQLTVGAQSNLTLLSTAAGTALLDMLNDGINHLTGSLTVQRYIDGSLTAGPAYRHLGAPVQGQKVSSFATTQGFTPYVNPTYNTNPASLTAANFPNVFYYEQSRIGAAGTPGTVGFDQGWLSPETTNDALPLGRGYTVHMPGNQTMSFTGIPLNNTASVGFTPRGTANSAGYNLTANPYAAPLNWDLLVADGGLLNLEPTLRVYKSTGAYNGSYATYLPATNNSEPISVNGGGPIIPLGQGFLVRSAQILAGSSLSLDPTYLSTSYDNTKDVKVQRGTADSRAMLRLSLGTADGSKAHETVVYFASAATAGTDKLYDATYLAGPGQQLSLMSETTGTAYSINGLPLLTGQSVQVALRLRAADAGTYLLSPKSLSNLPAGYHAYLLDASTGTRTDLALVPSVNVALAANTTLGGRYSVLFSANSSALASAPAALAALVSVYPNPAHGTVTLRLPAALRAGQATPIDVVNSLGQSVRTSVYPATAESLELRLDGLAAGIYTVHARTSAGPVSRRLVVE